jgi:hypothetical protein
MIFPWGREVRDIWGVMAGGGDDDKGGDGEGKEDSFTPSGSF